MRGYQIRLQVDFLIQCYFVLMNTERIYVTADEENRIVSNSDLEAVYVQVDLKCVFLLNEYSFVIVIHLY